MNVILRSVRKEDHQFLFELYASTRKEELAPLAGLPHSKSLS
jgi:hypothetical protein